MKFDAAGRRLHVRKWQLPAAVLVLMLMLVLGSAGCGGSNDRTPPACLHALTLLNRSYAHTKSAAEAYETALELTGLTFYHIQGGDVRRAINHERIAAQQMRSARHAVDLASAYEKNCWQHSSFKR